MTLVRNKTIEHPEEQPEEPEALEERTYMKGCSVTSSCPLTMTLTFVFAHYFAVNMMDSIMKMKDILPQKRQIMAITAFCIKRKIQNVLHV